MSTVRDILDSKGTTVHSIAPEATVQDAVITMCEHRVGALLVLDGERPPAGILSERDLLTRVLLQRKDPLTTRVRDVMTHHVACIDPDYDIERAMALMTNARCRHLPVLEGGKVVGLVSIGDLVREVGLEDSYELRAMREYVVGRYPG